MRKIINGLIIASLLMIILSGCSTQTAIQTASQTSSKYTISGVFPAMGDVLPGSFELSAPLPVFPDELQVYKMVKPEINEEYVRNMGAKFGLTGEVRQDSGGFAMQNQETGAYLTFRKPIGTFKYQISPYFDIPGAEIIKNPPRLPSDAEALKIATDFLVERDLLPQGDVAYKVDVGASFGEIPTCLLVSFKHAIGITGSKHGVRIGD